MIIVRRRGKVMWHGGREDADYDERVCVHGARRPGSGPTLEADAGGRIVRPFRGINLASTSIEVRVIPSNTKQKLPSCFADDHKF